MYAVGHLSLGYLSGKAASKVLNVNVNIALLFVISVLPDVDLLIPGLNHRGPLHSAVLFSLLFLPTFKFFGKRAVPYFVALIQHLLIGDYVTGATQLLWPLTTNWYGLGIDIASPINISIEWILFLASITIMFKTEDVRVLFQQHSSNMILSMPLLTVLLPTFLSFPLYVVLEIVLPHLIYITLFTFSILMYWKAIFAKT